MCVRVTVCACARPCARVPVCPCARVPVCPCAHVCPCVPACQCLSLPLSLSLCSYVCRMRALLTRPSVIALSLMIVCRWSMIGAQAFIYKNGPMTTGINANVLGQ